MEDYSSEEIQIMDAESAREAEFLNLPPDQAQEILNEQLFAKFLVPDLSVGFVNPLSLLDD